MKNWFSLLLCFLLSGGIWLIHNLSQTYSEIVNVPVTVASNIEGHARLSSTESTVSATVEASGFSLIRLNVRSRKPVEVFIDDNDFVELSQDYYRISPASLFKYSSTIFGDGVRVLNFVSDGISARFNRENCRKVPVRGVIDLDFKSQYMATGPVVFSPDSILVYGDPARLESIEAILTRPISRNDVRTSLHGIVKVDTPSGVRLSENEVSYQLNVSRFVELGAEAPIQYRNVPAGSTLSALPSRVKVTFRCEFPLIADPTSLAGAWVDFDEFSQSLAGHCLVHLDGIPSGVLEYDVEPQTVECFLITEQL